MPEEFSFDKSEDTEIVQRVVTDFNKASEARKVKEDKWLTWYKLYRSYAEEKKEGSNLFIPYIYAIIETIVPRIISAAFSARPYLGILPTKPETEENAKMMEKLIDYQLIQVTGFITTAVSWVKETLLYGTGILKVTWDYEEGQAYQEEPLAVIYDIPVGQQYVMADTIVKDDPLIEHIDIWDFYVDPYAQNIDDAAYCIHRVYRDTDYLKAKEKDGFYENIDEVKKGFSEQSYQTGMQDRLSSIGMQSSVMDVDTDKVELLEYWTDARTIVVANRSVIIRNVDNPYIHMKKPFVRLVDTLVPHEFYGIGEIEPCEHLQYELNSVRNQRMDNVNLIINKMWKVLRGSDIDINQLVSRANGVIEVDDMEDIEPLEFDNIAADSYNEDEIIRRDMDNATGTYDYARGETTDRRETATTASLLTTAANERFKLKITLMEDMGLRRLGELLVSLNQQFMDTQKIIRILGEDDGADFIELSPEQIRGQFDVMPLGSSIEPVTNRENRLNNMLNLYTALKDSPFVNLPELIKRILESADIKDTKRVLLQDPENMLMQQTFGGLAEGTEQDILPVNESEGVMENENM